MPLWHRSKVKRIVGAVGACATLAAGMAACGSDDASGHHGGQEGEGESAAAPSSLSAEEESAEQAGGSATSSPEEPDEASPSSPKDEDGSELKARLADLFAPLTSGAFFDTMDTCEELAKEKTWQCQSNSLGQFQLTNSRTEARTQYSTLTQLNGAEIIVDDGARLVGWSTLGSNAIITAVDTDDELVIKQLVDSGETDPERRIVEAGLATEEELADAADRAPTPSNSAPRPRPEQDR